MDTFLRLCVLGAALEGFSVLDKYITKHGFAKPYYAVHVVHNLAIVAFTTDDVMQSFGGTFTTTTPNWLAILLCFALHFYHIRDYYATLHYDDWLHHGLMIGVALPFSLLVDPTPLTGMNLFFTTGLPGAINYAALFAERNGWLTRSQEKAINVPVNVWLRAPGCVANATLIVVAGLSGSGFQQFIAFLIAALTAWNGLYFMQQVVVASQRPRQLNRE